VGRHKWNNEETAVLLATFQVNAFPKKDKLVQLSEILPATPVQIRNWFVYKRKTEGVEGKRKSKAGKVEIIKLETHFVK
jgi:hypothetical protein